ncbi:YcgJ family protein [Escherichia albertii]|uniref:YcgJ family protein n=1 Tax=Escherichia albertii TaxID=208962 RepID=UPI000AD7DCB8
MVGEYNPEEFTFLNGIFCNVKENLCRNDRYLGADGRRSGEINNNSTMILFGCIG